MLEASHGIFFCLKLKFIKSLYPQTSTLEAELLNFDWKFSFLYRPIFTFRIYYEWKRWFPLLLNKLDFICLTYYEPLGFRGCSYGRELARLGRLARLGEMIFIPRLYGIFWLIQSKSLLYRWKKSVSSNIFTVNSGVKLLCRTNVIQLTSEKQNKAN